jgi:exonuclease III
MSLPMLSITRTLRVITWNAGGLTVSKQCYLEKVIKQLDPHVILLQETKNVKVRHGLYNVIEQTSHRPLAHGNAVMVKKSLGPVTAC